MCDHFYGFCCGNQAGGCEELEERFAGGYSSGGFGPAPQMMTHPDSGSLPGPVSGRPHATVPRQIADDMATICQEAVRWFHESDHVFLGDPTVRTILDEEVRERIAGYQSELDAEWRRVSRLTPDNSQHVRPTGPDTLKYELSEMPFARQRALVERWEKVWTGWLEAHPGWTVTDDGFIPPSE